MKTFLFVILFLGLQSHSMAQTPDRDTSNIQGDLHIRNRCRPISYYIDAIKICEDSISSKAMEEVNIIIGGLPIHYGDIKSSTIVIDTPPVSTEKTTPKASDKVQNLATE